MLTGVRALVADDDRDYASALGELLESAGAEVVAHAEDAQQALVLAAEHEPDLVVLDVRMPGGGGPHAAAELTRALPGVRIVACSAYHEREDVEAIVRAGAHAYVVKGSGADVLVETMAEALSDRPRVDQRAMGQLLGPAAVGGAADGEDGPISVLIADDHPAIRELLADALAADPALQLVGAAEDAAGAVALGESLRPAVALLDVRMPGSGPVAARELRLRSPGTHILAFSNYGTPAAVEAMLTAGAIGYLLKDGPVDELHSAIHRAARGEGTVSEELVGEILRQRRASLRRTHAETEARASAMERLSSVLQGGWVRPVFQPIVDLASGTTVFFEALSRFDYEPSTYSPADWFAEAHALGMGEELELACLRAAAARLDEVPPGCRLALNLSPASILAPACRRLLTTLDLGRIVLEITENQRIEDYAELRDVLAPLRAAGILLAIDDVGDGFASLRHVLELEPDLLKLDITLVRAIESDTRRQSIIRGLVAGAAGIGCAVVAEGIETQEELRLLHELGVGLGQGYHLGMPGSLPAIEQLPVAA